VDDFEALHAAQFRFGLSVAPGIDCHQDVDLPIGNFLESRFEDLMGIARPQQRVGASGPAADACRRELDQITDSFDDDPHLFGHTEAVSEMAGVLDRDTGRTVVDRDRPEFVEVESAVIHDPL